MRIWGVLAVFGALAGCVEPMPQAPMPQAPVVDRAPLPKGAAINNFTAVVNKLEPVAERYCRRIGRVSNCAFRIVIDDRPDQPPNAFQSIDDAGRPLLAFTSALIAEARNADELAFVMGHEAAHHIAGHLGQSRDTAIAGAVLAGVLAQIGGASEAGITAAQDMGATVASRRFSKTYELEADALGAEIAYAAGFDPLRGAAFFDRLPDPGNRFLGTHPANAQRKEVVRATMKRLSN